MTKETAEATETTQGKSPDIQPTGKPEMDAEMAKWLVTKLDCPVQLNGHEDRNNFAACVNRLIAIAEWKEEK